MNKYIIFSIAVIALASAVHANENYISDGNSVYKVLNEITSSYNIKGGTFSVNYIILENQTEIDNLLSKEQNMNFSIAKASFESKKLEADNKNNQIIIDNDTAILSGIENEKSQSRDMLASIQSKKMSLENTISSSVLLPPESYNIGMAVFIILTILAVTMKSRNMLLKSQIDIKRKTIEKERSSE